MIDSSTAAHMVAQIRSKQRAIQSAQQYLINKVTESAEEQMSRSGDIDATEITDSLSGYKSVLESKRVEISSDKALITSFAINANKAALQMKMVEEWAAASKDNLVSELLACRLHRGLSNNITDALPALGADSETQFWGNENSSVSSMMLYLIAYHLGADVDVNIKYLAGAATLYPFVDREYSITVDPHPFLFNKSMILFGDYQLGGHKYFSTPEHNMGQRLFAPEDCSTAVGKSLHLTTPQLLGIWTGAIREEYPQYGLTPVTDSKDGKQIDMDRIETGDVFVRGGHTSIIYGKDNSGNIFTMDFNRDLNPEKGRGMLGGGTYNRNVFSAASNTAVMNVFRPTNAKLGENVSLNVLLAKIDSKFAQTCHEGVKNDIGDCSVFL